MQVAGKQKIYFENLDSLRTLAFLFVFFEHVWWRAFEHTSLEWYPFLYHTLYALLANGPMGVSIFFTLSGFLITYLLLTEIQQKGKPDIWAFYVRRTLRIWPLYFTFLLLVFVFIPLFNRALGIYYENDANPLMHLTFLSNFDVIRLNEAGLPNYIMTGITWSIGIEEQFYVLWPLLFLVVPKRGYAFIFLTFITGCILFRMLYINYPVYIYMHSLGVCGDLAVGGFAAYLVIYSASVKRFFEELPGNGRLLIYSLGILYLLYKDSYLLHHYSLGYSRFLSTVFFAFVILDQNFNRSSKGKMGKVRLLSNWGKYTYGLYLLHPIGLWLITLVVDYFNMNIDSFGGKSIVAVFVLLVTALMAYLSYYLLEKPFLKIKDRFAYITKQ